MGCDAGPHRKYWIDHNSRQTTWQDPRSGFNPRATLAAGTAVVEALPARGDQSNVPIAVAHPVPMRPPGATAGHAAGSAAASATPSVVEGLGGNPVLLEDVDLKLLDDADIPSAFTCSITGEIMRDPVVLVGSGNTYERSAISTWLASHRTDPLTNVNLQTKDQVLVPNVALRSAIEEFVQALRRSGPSPNTGVTPSAPPPPQPGAPGR